MEKYKPFSSIMETYLENRRRLATIPALPPPPSTSTSTSSVAKHPLFGPIPPQLLHKYRSPTLSISIPVHPPLQYSSPFTDIYMATIDDDPPFEKAHSVTLLNNTCPHHIIIDDVDTSFCPLLTEDFSFLLQDYDSFSLKNNDSDSDSFFLEEISATMFYQSLGKGSVLSTTDLIGKKVSDKPVSRKRKSDHIHFGSHNYNTRCKAKRCF